MGGGIIEETTGEATTTTTVVTSPSIIRKFFGDLSDAILDVRIAKKPDGKSRGFAYVEFKTENAAKDGQSYNGKELDGRALNIDASNNSSGNQGGRGGYQGGIGGYRGRG